MRSGHKKMGARIVRSSGFTVGVMTGTILVSAAVALVGSGLADARQSTRASVETLFSTSSTIVGETIAYPAGTPAKVTAAIVTLPHGASTGWHKHGVPLFGYILEGELSVDYGAQGVRVYRAGDGFMEAMNVAHDGRNAGGSDVRILAVYMAADGLTLSHEAEEPSK